MQPRREDYITTFSGRSVLPGALQADDIWPEDVAHHLALQNRFAGATREPYSVVQHCVLASWMVSPSDEADAFSHDHHEYIVTDVPTPLKRLEGLGRAYAAVEDSAERCMRHALGLPREPTTAVRRADYRLFLTERRDLIDADPGPWFDPFCAPWPNKVRPWGWRKAKRLFLARYRELFPTAAVPLQTALVALELQYERRRFTRIPR